MAARNSTERINALQRGITKLWFKLLGTGATPTTIYGIGGVVTRTSAGVYVITLSDKWAGLVGYYWGVEDLTGPVNWNVTLTSETVATTKIITLNVKNAAGAATDLSADEKMYIELTLLNSAIVPVKG